MHETVIHLHRDAPPKPPTGEPCNGCGVCCAISTCPAARLRFLRASGPCPALEWRAGEAHYRCGFLQAPKRYFPALPLPEALMRRLLARWIAAGIGCDCAAESA